MSYKIFPTKEFSKDFKRIDLGFQKNIKIKIQEISEDSTRYKKLHYELSGSLRVRIDKLRLIFSYDELAQELYLEKIVFGHKYA